jgi:hypothetical protein
MPKVACSTRPKPALDEPLMSSAPKTSYEDCHHYGEAISTAFVESTVNEVVSRRMVKKQQMRWTRRGAHLLLQVRNQTLNDDLRETFGRWYPAMPLAEISTQLAA